MPESWDKLKMGYYTLTPLPSFNEYKYKLERINESEDGVTFEYTSCNPLSLSPMTESYSKDFFKHKLTPKRIIFNGPATIVFWKDGTKTIVKRAEKDPDNKYNAFCAALAKKIFESNSKINSIVKRAEKDPDNKYNAFCEALVKKIFESNSKINSIVKSGEINKED